MKSTKLLVAAAAMLAIASAAQGTPRPGQGTWENTLKARDIHGNPVDLHSASAAFFYDTELNITWLADMNHAKTSGLSADGKTSWYGALNWVNSLTVGSFSGWRLPTMLDTGTAGCNSSYIGTDCGYNVQTKHGNTVYNEMAHLFHVTLGNLSICGPTGQASCPQAGYGLTNTANFRNMQSGFYWHGLEYDADYDYNAWYFFTDYGYQYASGKSGPMYAMAVRPGDVAAVPEAHTYAMLLLGLGAVMVAMRRRSRKGN